MEGVALISPQYQYDRCEEVVRQKAEVQVGSVGDNMRTRQADLQKHVCSVIRAGCEYMIHQMNKEYYYSNSRMKILW